jgi:hypothetical protein
MRVHYSNPEQSPASHYNPDPIARRADVSVNGATAEPVLFPHSFHRNNFWVLTVPVELEAGSNTIRFSSEEAPNFDGETYASDVWPDFPLRSRWAPIVDSIEVAPFSAEVAQEPASPVSAAVTTECRGKQAFVVVELTNTSDERTAVTVSAFGQSRERETLKPGKAWRQPFAAGASSTEAGTVTVTAGGVSTEHAHEAVACR